jgi:ferric-dicitrate binding protein FerR (iron transport regulator)
VKRTLAAVTFLLLLCVPVARTQERVISARAGLVIGVEGEVLYHCHEKGDRVERLQAGERLHDGDQVFTSATGRASWTLNADSYMRVAADSAVRVYDTSLDRMHFDVDRGEVVVCRSLKDGASLVVHAPPGLLTVHKPGRYLFRVGDGGETEASVEKGELRYEEKGKTVSVKKGRKVTFQRVEKKTEHEA